METIIRELILETLCLLWNMLNLTSETTERLIAKDYNN